MISSDIKTEIMKLLPRYFKNAFPEILSWKELENLLNLRPFVNHKRFKIVNSKNYTWNNQGWLTDVDTYPPSLIQKELAHNLCSIIDASRINENVNFICKDLETTFAKSCVDAHVYFTVADDCSDGFGIHWDYSHNLIVQVHGVSHIDIWNCEAKETNVDNLKEDPAISVTLSPGDAVFVPMKVYHRVVSLSKRLSISFPISYDMKWESQDRHWVKL